MKKIPLIIPAIFTALTATQLMAGQAGSNEAAVVPVCHKIQGSSLVKKPMFTLLVPESEVQAHLDHGDELGKLEDGLCGGDEPGGKGESGGEGEPIG